MALKDSGFAGLKTRIKRVSADISATQINALDRVLRQWIPGFSSQLTCLSYRVLFPALTRAEHLASLRTRVPPLHDDNSPLQSCIQIAGSINLSGALPEYGLIQRESASELLSDRLHRRTKQIRLRVRNRYLADSACFLDETLELHYRLKPQLSRSSLLQGEHTPDLFDYRLLVEEAALFAYMALLPAPERASIDYVYATQTLGCPGLLVPMDLVGLLLLNLHRQRNSEGLVKSFDFHVYGQLYTRQPIRLCATAVDAHQVLMWAESDGYLLYRGILNLF